MSEKMNIVNNEYYINILDNISILVCCYYPDFTIKYVNKAYCNFFNKTKEELIGKKFLMLIPEKDHKEVISNIASLNMENTERTYTHKVIAGNGEIRWQNWNDKAIFDKNGNPILYYSFGKDITEHKQSAIEIAKNRLLLEKERNFAESIISTAQVIILVLDIKGKIVSINPYLENISGYTQEEVKGKDWFDLFLKEDIRDNVKSLFNRAISNMSTKGNVNSIITKDGRELEIEWYDKTLKGDRGQVIGILAVGLDITDRLKAEEQLRISETRYRKVTALISDWVFEIEIHNNTKKVTFIGGPFLEITGYTYEDVKSSESWGKVIHKEDLSMFKDFLNNLILNENEGNIEIRVYHKDDLYYWYNVNCRALTAKDGNVKLLGIASNIDKRKKVEQGLIELNKKLESLAYKDTLTGALNRKPFIELFARNVKRAERKKEKLALLFLDLEKFKTVNDIYGHTFGDKVLIRAVELIKGCIRTSDIVGRLGGDEFLVCLGDIRSLEDVMRVAAKINDAFIPANIIDGIPVNVTVSIGISMYPDDSRDIDDLLKNSDLAMYKAKKELHNSFKVYHKKYRQEVMFEQALSQALKNNEFEILYQPIVNKYGKCVIIEPLLRWNSPEFGYVLPDGFIPILEKHKTINEVGLWAFDKICHKLNKINSIDGHLNQTRMSVNLSGIQIETIGFLDSFMNTMRNSDVCSQNIIFEITEEQRIKDVENVIAIMSELKDKCKAKIALDDYGSGFSSFLNITKLPIDIVKIDRPLIENMNDELLCNATLGLISLIKKLGLEVVAEGVENEDQFLKLKEVECDYFQGFLFSNPVSDIVGLLEAENNNFLN